jgi:hypothetical protein
MRELEEGMEGSPWVSEREDDDDGVVRGLVAKEVIRTIVKKIVTPLKFKQHLDAFKMSLATGDGDFR